MMSETPLGHDRATSTYDPRRPTSSHRDVRKPHAGVYGEVINALLGLFDQSVAKDFPGQLLSFAANFFQGLVDRHGADWHRRVAYDPFAGGVNVLTCREIHH